MIRYVLRIFETFFFLFFWGKKIFYVFFLSQIDPDSLEAKVKLLRDKYKEEKEKREKIRNNNTVVLSGNNTPNSSSSVVNQKSPSPPPPAK